MIDVQTADSHWVRQSTMVRLREAPTLWHAAWQHACTALMVQVALLMVQVALATVQVALATEAPTWR